MNRKELIKKYIEFFASKKHKEIPNVSLTPSNDPTVLFTTAGMHPLVPYLLGQKHPLGKRLVGVQKCIRTGDIDSVGDEVHHTFFEMLGNWSLGDYWKKEAIEYSFEFLTKILKIPKEKISVTCFKGDKDTPKDTESAKTWESQGISKNKIKFLEREDNWWGPAGKSGPCGPDTEIFVNGVEIWNDVFMEYEKKEGVILVDGMNCAYDKNFNPNKELLDIINGFNKHCILTVNGFREKGIKIIRNYNPSYDTNWEAFSLEEIGVKKDNPDYFKKLLIKFKPELSVKDVIFFDHKEENVKVAKTLGITAIQYKNPDQIKKFIEENLYFFESAKQKNVDTGMGVERTLAVLNGLNDNYLTEVWKPMIEKIEKMMGTKIEGGKPIRYEDYNNYIKREMRIIVDHIKAAIFIISEGIEPGRNEQSYVLRRLIRRAVRYGKRLKLPNNFTSELVDPVLSIYGVHYPEIKKNRSIIISELKKEEDKFNETLGEGIKYLQKIVRNLMEKGLEKASDKDVFLLYQSYGFPIEMIEEEFKNNNIKIDIKAFEAELKKHQELSRTSSQGLFKSGLADSSEKTTKLHTATHLLNEALRVVLKDKNIKQRGSNITPERLRFDFNFSRKLTEQEVREIEKLVNDKIKQSLEIKRSEMNLKDAIKSGAQAEFGAKYPEIVSVYTIGQKNNPFSKEICTGPHVKNTNEIGRFKIVKEESSAAGVRRIKAEVLD